MWANHSAEDEFLRALFAGLPPAKAALMFELSIALEAFADALIAAERARCAEVAERYEQYLVAREIRNPAY